MNIHIHESPDADSPPSRVWDTSEVAALKVWGLTGDEDVHAATRKLERHGLQLLKLTRSADLATFYVTKLPALDVSAFEAVWRTS